MGLAATLVAAAPSSAEAVSPNLDPQHTRSAVRLGSLTSLAAQRILLGDKVAAAKFGTDQPIDDPSRERHELDAVAAMAAREGVDTDASVRFFRAQIEANKVVQRGLYALWTEHPGLRPGERPDLGGEVRPRLDQLTTEIVRELKATQEVRAAAGCRELLANSRLSAEVRFRLDALHRRALTIALRPVCACASG